MLQVISARRVARALRTISSGPLARTCWRRFAAQRGDCKIISTCALECDFYFYLFLYIYIVLGTLMYSFSFAFQAIPTQIILCAVTLREKLQLKLSTSPSQQYTDTGPTSPGADPITPGSYFEATGMTLPGKRSTAKTGIAPRSVTYVGVCARVCVCARAHTLS